MIYYNEIDPYAAQWLRNLIAAGHLPAGDVDERSIVDVQPDDLRGYTQCHFFAGIGGWAYAARLAGIPDDFPIWTGSCPCQPFSSAGKRRATEDERHLWPEFYRLIRECAPGCVAGEQVDSSSALQWLDIVWEDMERKGYAFRASSLCASLLGLPARKRLFWLAESDCKGERRGSVDAEMARISSASGRLETAWFTHEGVVSARDGFPERMGRLRAYGNAIVPQVAAEFLKAYLRT